MVSPVSGGPHPNPDPRPAAPTKGAIFVRRLVSTLVLWTVILAALFSGNALLSDTVFIVIMTGLAAVGLDEFYGLAEKRGLANFPRLGLAGGALLMIGTFFRLQGSLGGTGTPGAVNDFESGFLILFVLGLGLRQLWAKDNPHGLQAIAL